MQATCLSLRCVATCWPFAKMRSMSVWLYSILQADKLAMQRTPGSSVCWQQERIWAAEDSA